MNQLWNRIKPFLNEFIPDDLALKGISKIDPKLGKFLQRGISQGLPLASGLSYLKDQFSKGNEPKIDKTLRPDERESQATIQRGEKQSQNLKNLAKLGLGVAGGAAAGRLAGGLLESAMEGLGGNSEESQQQEMPQDPKQQAAAKFMQRKQGMVDQLQDQFKQNYEQNPQLSPQDAYDLVASSRVFEDFKNLGSQFNTEKLIETLKSSMSPKDLRQLETVGNAQFDRIVALAHQFLQSMGGKRGNQQQAQPSQANQSNDRLMQAMSNLSQLLKR